LQYTSSVKDVALVTISSGADAGIYAVIDSAHSSGYSAAQGCGYQIDRWN